MNNPNEISDEALATLISHYVNSKIQGALPSKPKEPKKPPFWKGLLVIVAPLVSMFLVSLFFQYLAK